MKRSRKAFVIEHKRRSRTAASTQPSIWTGAAGRQMRELALAGERTDASANLGAHEVPHARAAAAPSTSGARRRILEARAEPCTALPDVESEEPIDRSVVSGPSEPDASSLGRPASRKASKFGTSERADDGSKAVTPRSGPAMSEDEPTTTRSRPAAPSWRERRLSLRKTLPLQDRWKWDQPF